MNAQSSSAVSSAVNSWRNCYSSGSSFGFPIPTTTPVSNASSASLTVNYVTGYHPSNNSACAGFSGSTITIYERARDPSGAIVMCSSFGFQNIIAHELGHFYGLDDVTSTSCSSVMRQLGVGFGVTAGDCAVARDQNNTPSDNNNPYPTCGEPCAGSCTTDGNCEATTRYTSPLLISLSGNRFALSGLADPVFFDIDNDGELRRTGWTRRASDTALLALDLDTSGTIDSGGELFGNRTTLADGTIALNGFVALAQYDAVTLGGNGDQQIDADDAIWASLRLWLDDDHDAVTDPGELVPLWIHGLARIDLDYRFDKRVDRFGNVFGLRGSASIASGDGPSERRILVYDVFFVRE